MKNNSKVGQWKERKMLASNVVAAGTSNLKVQSERKMRFIIKYRSYCSEAMVIELAKRFDGYMQLPHDMFVRHEKVLWNCVSEVALCHG